MEFKKYAHSVPPKEEEVKEGPDTFFGTPIPIDTITGRSRLDVAQGGLAGLRPGFKYGGTWKDWILNHEDQMTFEEYLKMDIEKDDSE